MYITELPSRIDSDFHLKNLIEDLILQLVEDRDVVCVEEISKTGSECVLQITVSSKEIGKVIGKNRAIIQSLWNLVVAITRGQKKVVIQILNPAGEVQYPGAPPESKSTNNGINSHLSRPQH